MTKSQAHKLLVTRLNADLKNKLFFFWLEVERVGDAVREKELTRSLDDLLDYLDPDDPKLLQASTKICVQLPEIEFSLIVRPRQKRYRGTGQLVGNPMRTIWMVDGVIQPDD